MMSPSTVLITLLSFIVFTKTITSLIEIPICDDLPATCHYIKDRREYKVTNLPDPKTGIDKKILEKWDYLACANGFDATMTRHFERFLNKCLETKPSTEIELNSINISMTIRLSSERSILSDSSFKLFKVASNSNKFSFFNIKIFNLKGFDVNSLAVTSGVVSIIA